MQLKITGIDDLKGKQSQPQELFNKGGVPKKKNKLGPNQSED